LLAACGGDGETCGESSRWSSETVQTRNEPYGTLPSLAFADDSTLHLVHGWYLFDDEIATGYGGVSWVRRSGGSWDDESVESTQEEVGAASVELAADRMHFAWMFEDDLFYRERAGDAWSGPAVDLTSSVELEAVSSSAIAVSPDGELAAVYGVDNRLRLAWIEDGGIAGEPVTLLEEDLGCYVWHAAFDARGALNVAATCATNEKPKLHWITVAPDGSVSTEALWSTAMDASQFDRLAAISPNGDAHLLWVRSTEEGLLHAQRVGGTWTEPVMVAPSEGNAKYAIVTASDEELIVAYPALRVSFLSSRGGQPMAPDCDRLPDLVLPIEAWWPALAFDAGTGTLVTLYNTEQTSWPDGEFAVASLQL
jgi:hypothetical protein